MCCLESHEWLVWRGMIQFFPTALFAGFSWRLARHYPASVIQADERVGSWRAVLICLLIALTGGLFMILHWYAEIR